MVVVLHVITSFGSGGAENQLRQLVLGSDRLRSRHIVVSLSGFGPIAAELRSAGVEVHSLKFKHGLSSFTGFIRLVSLLRRSQPEIMHCWLYHGCFVGLIAARLAGIQRVVWGLRSANPTLKGYPILTRQVVRICARLSGMPDTVIVNSEASLAAHIQLGYTTKRLQVIPNGVDVEHYRPDEGSRESVRRELGLSNDAVLVGMIARFNPMKDHTTFVRAAALVHYQNPEVHFVLVGERADTRNEPLSLLLRDNRLLEAFHLLGPRSDVSRITAALDIACLSSWSESWPNVIAEAMACGVPCVATNVGDVSRIIGEGGQVVSPRDARALARGIVRLIQLTPSERQKIGALGRQRICSKFPLAKTLESYASIYETLSGEMRGAVAPTAA